MALRWAQRSKNVVGFHAKDTALTSAKWNLPEPGGPITAPRSTWGSQLSSVLQKDNANNVIYAENPGNACWQLNWRGGSTFWRARLGAARQPCGLMEARSAADRRGSPNSVVSPNPNVVLETGLDLEAREMRCLFPRLFSNYRDILKKTLFPQ